MYGAWRKRVPVQAHVQHGLIRSSQFPFPKNVNFHHAEFHAAASAHADLEYQWALIIGLQEILKICPLPVHLFAPIL
ncbi:hypothetical protein SAMN05216308_105248 [Nitrosospira sp. Nsp13]|jgi:hypothetical protein|nr:hypothetical protein SAMN05216308_105248 [Nitrosospira sp. Nsp13]